MTKPVKLSATARKLLSEFDEAAKLWGWESDQGTGDSVTRAGDEYDRTKRRLELFIARLERKA